MQMTLPGSSELIKILKLMASTENPLIYDASQSASISTLGHDPGHKLSISLISPLVLTKVACGRGGESHSITAVRVFFKNQELTVNNPAKFIPENSKVEGLLHVSAEVKESDKMGTY